MRWKGDLHVGYFGYLPERINPANKEHTLTRIVKVVAGDTAETPDKVVELYGDIVSACVYSASSLRIAEADKIGYHPQVILTGGRINDGMGKFVAEQT